MGRETANKMKNEAQRQFFMNMVINVKFSIKFLEFLLSNDGLLNNDFASWKFSCCLRSNQFKHSWFSSAYFGRHFGALPRQEMADNEFRSSVDLSIS